MKTNDLTEVNDWACKRGKPSLPKLQLHSLLQDVDIQVAFGNLLSGVLLFYSCEHRREKKIKKSNSSYHRLKVSQVILLILSSLTTVNTYLETVLLLQSLEMGGIRWSIRWLESYCSRFIVSETERWEFVCVITRGRPSAAELSTLQALTRLWCFLPFHLRLNTNWGAATLCAGCSAVRCKNKFAFTPCDCWERGRVGSTLDYVHNQSDGSKKLICMWKLHLSISGHF